MTDDALALASAPNLRDLGGIPAAAGRVRSGLLYRADSLARLSDPDLAALERAGLRQVIDLRTRLERESSADRVPAGAEYVVLDVQRDHTTGGDLATLLSDPVRARALLADNGAERFMHQVYRALAGTEDARTAYRELVERAASGPLPLVFHCFAGKDRTGWGAVLLLTLLGVDREDAVADYLASNDRLSGVEEQMTLLADAYGIDPALVAPLLVVRRSYLDTAFAEVDASYGGFDRYVSEGLRLAPETVAALRERLVEPTAGG